MTNREESLKQIEIYAHTIYLTSRECLVEVGGRHYKIPFDNGMEEAVKTGKQLPHELHRYLNSSVGQSYVLSIIEL